MNVMDSIVLSKTKNPLVALNAENSETRGTMWKIVMNGFWNNDY